MDDQKKQRTFRKCYKKICLDPSDSDSSSGCVILLEETFDDLGATESSSKISDNCQHSDSTCHASGSSECQNISDTTGLFLKNTEIPGSLFDRPSAAVLRMRRITQLQGAVPKCRPLIAMSNTRKKEIIPEWLIEEDNAILQVLHECQGLPLCLTRVLPSWTPNWDLCADAVNSVRGSYKSMKQCKERYFKVIMPRLKKIQKTKGDKAENNPKNRQDLLQKDDPLMAIYQTKNRLFRALAKKRQRKEALERKNYKPPDIKKESNVKFLAENGINFHENLSPLQIAERRTERIAREKREDTFAVKHDAKEVLQDVSCSLMDEINQDAAPENNLYAYINEPVSVEEESGGGYELLEELESFFNLENTDNLQ